MKPKKMREYVVEYISALTKNKQTIYVYANSYSSARSKAENALSKDDRIVCIGEK